MIDPRTIRWPIRLEIRPDSRVTKGELERLAEKLSTDETPIIAAGDPESAFFLVGACDEARLDDKCRLLTRRGKEHSPGGFRIGVPTIGYLETVRDSAEADYTYEQWTSKGRHSARVKIAVEPMGAQFDCTFENRAGSGAEAGGGTPGIDGAVQSFLHQGLVSGYPMVGLKVVLKAVLVDGAQDAGLDSAPFDAAVRRVLRQAVSKAGPVLLEPILGVAVTAPDDHATALIEDLGSRRGVVSGTESQNRLTTITALVPTGNMFGFTDTLVKISKGQGTFSTWLSHYDEAPSSPGDDPRTPEPGVAALRAS